MKHFTTLIILLLCASKYGHAQPESGLFKMGLISMTWHGESTQDPFLTSMIREQMTASSTYDLYFSRGKILAVYQFSETQLRLYYDTATQLVTQLLTTPKKSYANIMNLREMHEMVAGEDLSTLGDSMETLIRISPLMEDNKMIHGFQCQRVTIPDPETRQSELFTMYCTASIPVHNMMGPLSEYFPGFPLETKMQLMGFTIITGVMEFYPGLTNPSIMNPSTKKHKIVSADEFKTLLQEYQ